MAPPGNEFLFERFIAPEYMIIKKEVLYIWLIQNDEFVEKVKSHEDGEKMVYNYLFYHGWGCYMETAIQELSQSFKKKVVLKDKEELLQLVVMLREFFAMDEEKQLANTGI